MPTVINLKKLVLSLVKYTGLILVVYKYEGFYSYVESYYSVKLFQPCNIDNRFNITEHRHMSIGLKISHVIHNYQPG